MSKEKHIHASVTQGKEVKHKKNLISLLLCGEDIDAIGKSLVDDYILPRSDKFVKDSIQRSREFVADTIHDCVDTVFLGKAGRRTTLKNGGSYTNYVKFSSNGGSDYTPEKKVDKDPKTRVKVVAIDTLGQAEEVYGDLLAAAKRYGAATVADYYELVGITPDTTDYNWGWGKKQLDDEPSITHVTEGYIINFPKPLPVE